MPRTDTDKELLLATIYDILKERRKPTHITEITADVLEAVPLAARHPRSVVRKALALGLHAVHYGDGRWMLPQKALQGYTFRCTPHAAEIAAGVLFTQVRFSPFIPYYPGGTKAIQLVDQTSNTALVVAVDHTPHSLVRLADWYACYDFQAGDSIIVRAIDLTASSFELAYEPADKKQIAVLALNQTFADIAYGLFQHARQEEVLVDSLVPGVLVQMPQLRSYPPDDYRDVFSRDGRFRLLEQGTVSTVDYRRPIDYLHVFFKWGKATFNALNPGYLTPLESGEEATPEPTAHWLRLLGAQVLEFAPDEGQLKLRLDMESSAGDFSSELGLALGAAPQMTRSILATLRRRFKSLVADRVRTTASGKALQQVTIEDEPQVGRRLAEFLRPLTAAAANPPDEATLERLRQAQVTLAAPRTP